MARQTYTAFVGGKILKGLKAQRAHSLREAGYYVQTAEHVHADDRDNPHYIVRMKSRFLRKAGPRVRVTLEMANWAEAQGDYLIESAADNKLAARGRQPKNPRIVTR